MSHHDHQQPQQHEQHDVVLTASAEHDSRELERHLHGELIRPGQADYDAARRVWNRCFDKRPALIARCADARDVARAVRFARDHMLPIAVRSGGHSHAGYGVWDGAVMIDLSRMKGLHIDPERHLARVEPGITTGELLQAAYEYGLAFPAGTFSSVGLAGLTLGGGIGSLASKFGLACDALLAADVVTAEGELLTADAQTHPELYWALRGGGGNFGVVTALTLQLYPLRQVLAGALIHPIARAGEVLRFVREYAAVWPDELTVHVALASSPDGHPIVAVLPCYSGPLAEGERVLAPLRSFGSPLADVIRPMTFADAITPPSAPQNSEALKDKLLKYRFKGRVVPALSDDAIEAIVACGARRPSPLEVIVVRHEHGAFTRVDPAATAYALRSEHYFLELITMWTDEDDAAPHVSWTTSCWQAMGPYAAAGVPVNFLDDDDGEAEVRASYSPNFSRLVAVKQRYDPDNVFHLNQNIPPSVAL